MLVYSSVRTSKERSSQVQPLPPTPSPLGPHVSHPPPSESDSPEVFGGRGVPLLLLRDTRHSRHRTHLRDDPCPVLPERRSRSSSGPHLHVKVPTHLVRPRSYRVHVQCLGPPTTPRPFQPTGVRTSQGPRSVHVWATVGAQKHGSGVRRTTRDVNPRPTSPEPPTLRLDVHLAPRVTRPRRDNTFTETSTPPGPLTLPLPGARTGSGPDHPVPRSW